MQRPAFANDGYCRGFGRQQKQLQVARRKFKFFDHRIEPRLSSRRETFGCRWGCIDITQTWRPGLGPIPPCPQGLYLRSAYRGLHLLRLPNHHLNNSTPKANATLATMKTTQAQSV